MFKHSYGKARGLGLWWFRVRVEDNLASGSRILWPHIQYDKVRPNDLIAQITSVLKSTAGRSYLDGPYIYRITVREPQGVVRLLKLDSLRKRINPGDFADIVTGSLYHHALYKLPLEVTAAIMKEYVRVATQLDVVVRPNANEAVEHKRIMIA